MAKKETLEEKQAAQVASIEAEQKRILEEFDTLRKELTEGKYDEQSYSAGSKITISAEVLTRMSHLLPHMQQNRIDRIKEAIDTNYRICNDLLALLSLEVFDLNNEMTKAHIAACKAGETVHRSVVDKEDAKHKVSEIIQDDTPKIIVPETPKIITD
jgi:DNA repair exonuclease SbcCD ATPase subunit